MNRPHDPNVTGDSPSNNRSGDASQANLRDTGVKIEVGQQLDPDSGEKHEYLWEGDCE